MTAIGDMVAVVVAVVVIVVVMDVVAMVMVAVDHVVVVIVVVKKEVVENIVVKDVMHLVVVVNHVVQDRIQKSVLVVHEIIIMKNQRLEMDLEKSQDHHVNDLHQKIQEIIQHQRHLSQEGLFSFKMPFSFPLFYVYFEFNRQSRSRSGSPMDD